MNRLISATAAIIAAAVTLHVRVIAAAQAEAEKRANRVLNRVAIASNALYVQEQAIKAARDNYAKLCAESLRVQDEVKDEILELERIAAKARPGGTHGIS